MVYRELDTKATYLILLKKRVTFLFVRDRDMSKQRLPIGRYSNGKPLRKIFCFDGSRIIFGKTHLYSFLIQFYKSEMSMVRQRLSVCQDLYIGVFIKAKINRF